MYRVFPLLVTALAILALGATACETTELDPKFCMSDADCPADQFCIDRGVCMPRSSADGDVPDGDTVDIPEIEWENWEEECSGEPDKAQPPVCMTWTCLPAAPPQCWDCMLMADPGQNGDICADDVGNPGICNDGVCQTFVDGDVDDTVVDGDEPDWDRDEYDEPWDQPWDEPDTDYIDQPYCTDDQCCIDALGDTCAVLDPATLECNVPACRRNRDCRCKDCGPEGQSYCDRDTGMCMCEGQECTDNDPPYCSGDLLYFCENGEWVFVDCRPTACVSYGNGAICEEPVDGDEDIDVIDGDEDEGPMDCTVDEDCPWGYGCVYNICQYMNECMEARDCNVGETCENVGNFNQCRPVYNQCETDADCPWGEVCISDPKGNYCQASGECATDADCPEGFVCVAGDQGYVCEPVGNQCEVHTDCDFGYRCNTDASPFYCEEASQCRSDADCPSFQTCQVVENWKECQFGGSEFCQSDADCPAGSYCEVIFGNFGQCRSLNECSTDAECPAGMECELNEQLGYNECIEVNPCQTDEDCGFGFRCVPGDDRNVCEYANECSNSEDCAQWEVCQPEGNWNVCSINTQPDFCQGDEDCPEGSYCDLVFGLFGTCKSKDECQVDADCPQGTVCESNGTYNECVATNPQQCWFDFQCPDGWACVDNVCDPPSAVECPELDKTWTVWNSSCQLVTAGQSFTFQPEDGCNGSIIQGDLGIPVGNFSEGEDGASYDISLMFMYQCTASSNLGLFLTLDCGDCQVSLGGM